MESDVETAKRVLGRLNKAPYVETSPREFDALNNPSWYVTCLDGYYYGRTAHADTVWADAQGAIWLDSTHLESTTNWVEWAYGEKGAIESMKGDYRNLSIAEVQSKLRPFKKVYDFIETCRRIVVETSERSGVKLELLSSGEKTIAWFFLRAQVRSKGESLETRLKETNEALSEAYNRILEAENKQFELS